MEYINDDVKYPYDPLLKIAVSHYQFEAIHPFRDGNGRTGRVLSILLMIQKHLLDVPILYLSAYIIREKEGYYELLKNVTAHRNWSQWIIYMLKAIEETSRYTISKIEEIDRLFTRTKELINTRYPSIRKEFIEKLFEYKDDHYLILKHDSYESIRLAKSLIEDEDSLYTMLCILDTNHAQQVKRQKIKLRQAA